MLLGCLSNGFAAQDNFHGGWTELTRVHSSDVEWNQALALPLAHRFFQTRPADDDAPSGGGAAASASPATNASSSGGGPLRGRDVAVGMLCGALLLQLSRRLLASK